MLSLVTVFQVITAFHSCCLSHHVFDQVNLGPAWVGIETAIFWQCSPGTVETQRLYPLRHGPRRAIKARIFGLINPIICSPYLVFRSRVRTEFVIVFNWNHFEMRLLEKPHLKMIPIKDNLHDKFSIGFIFRLFAGYSINFICLSWRIALIP